MEVKGLWGAGEGCFGLLLSSVLLTNLVLFVGDSWEIGGRLQMECRWASGEVAGVKIILLESYGLGDSFGVAPSVAALHKRSIGVCFWGSRMAYSIRKETKDHQYQLCKIRFQKLKKTALVNTFLKCRSLLIRQVMVLLYENHYLQVSLHYYHSTIN